jgi:hypothetical protein
MTSTALQPTTASHRSLAGVVIGAIVLLTAITVVLLLTVGRLASGSTGTSGAGTDQDNSNCRPTTVVHYC